MRKQMDSLQKQKVMRNGLEHVDAYNTYQVKKYDRYALAAFPEPMKRKYREEHWEQDLQRAFDAGKRMAEKIK